MLYKTMNNFAQSIGVHASYTCEQVTHANKLHMRTSCTCTLVYKHPDLTI